MLISSTSKYRNAWTTEHNHHELRNRSRDKTMHVETKTNSTMSTTSERALVECDRQAQWNPVKGELSPKIKFGLCDRATPEKFFGVSLAYVRSLEGSQKAG